MNKKLKLFSLGLIITIGISLVSFNQLSKKITTDYVYVCGKSKIYHDSRTHGALDRCKSGITKMTESKAKSLGKRKCKCRY